VICVVFLRLSFALVNQGFYMTDSVDEWRCGAGEASGMDVAEKFSVERARETSDGEETGETSDGRLPGEPRGKNKIRKTDKWKAGETSKAKGSSGLWGYTIPRRRARSPSSGSDTSSEETWRRAKNRKRGVVSSSMIRSLYYAYAFVIKAE
jgi:hypothetical protein